MIVNTTGMNPLKIRHSLSLCSRVLLKKLTFPRLVDILPYFMEETFHYSFHNSPPLSPNLSQINFAHVILFYSFKIRVHFNIILPSVSNICELSCTITFSPTYYWYEINYCLSLLENVGLVIPFPENYYCVLYEIYIAHLLKV
jgi:hypothetical protein